MAISANCGMCALGMQGKQLFLFLFWDETSQKIYTQAHMGVTALCLKSHEKHHMQALYPPFKARQQ